MRRMNLDPTVAILLIASVALLFASAAIHKLRDLARFEEIFAAYDLLPGGARWHLSWAIPVLELCGAVGLLIPQWRPLGGALCIGLLLAYAGAIAINLLRGRRDLACGCGGPNDRRPIAGWMIWRNLLAALAAGAAFAHWDDRALSFTDGITICFGVLTLVLVYLCVDQLFGNAARSAQIKGVR